MSDTVKVELPTWKNMDKPHKTWLKEIHEYFAAIGEHRVLHKELAPKEPELQYPEVGTPEAFLARVCKHPKAMELVAMAGMTLTATQLRGLKVEDVDDGALQQYQRNVKRHNRKLEKQLDEIDSWPEKLKATIGNFVFILPFIGRCHSSANGYLFPPALPFDTGINSKMGRSDTDVSDYARDSKPNA